MKILIDSKEQLPLDFNCETENSSLNIGDYACKLDDGFIAPVVFERKSISDLFNTVTKDNERFQKECERAKEKGVFIIIISEATRTQIKGGHRFSTQNGEKILKVLDTLYLKYQIPTFFCNGRFEASKRIEDMCLSIERRYSKKGKNFFWDDKLFTK